MNDAQRYRMNAVECLSAAERCEPSYRGLTLATAASWLSLARQQEAMDELLAIWSNAQSATPIRPAAFLALCGTPGQMGKAGMTASVVRFPESGAYPAAPLSEDDERVIALIRRSPAATRALDRDGVRLDEDESPNSQVGLHRLLGTTSKPEDDLAEVARRYLLIAGWLAALATSLGMRSIVASNERDLQWLGAAAAARLGGQGSGSGDIRAGAPKLKADRSVDYQGCKKINSSFSCAALAGARAGRQSACKKAKSMIVH